MSDSEYVLNTMITGLFESHFGMRVGEGGVKRKATNRGRRQDIWLLDRAHGNCT